MINHVTPTVSFRWNENSRRRRSRVLSILSDGAENMVPQPLAMIS